MISDTSNFTSSIPPYPSPKTFETSKEFSKSSYFGAQVFTYKELEVATDNFNDSRELGDGGFGTVYYGKTSRGPHVLFLHHPHILKLSFDEKLKRLFKGWGYDASSNL